MSLATARGGPPQVMRVAATSGSATKVTFRTAYNSLKLRTDAACKVFFTQTDATNGTNYVHLPTPSPSTPFGEWSGPADIYTNVGPSIWLQSDAGTANVEAVAFLRLG